MHVCTCVHDAMYVLIACMSMCWWRAKVCVMRRGLTCGGAAAALAFATAGSVMGADKSAYSILNPTPDRLLRDMTTDRPDTTESPFTVDAGRVQVETNLFGFARSRPDEDGVVTDSYELVNANVRIGITSDTEIGFVWQSYGIVRSRHADPVTSFRHDGIGGLDVRGKVNLWGNDAFAKPGDTALALLPFLTLPTDDDNGISPEDVEGGLLVPLAINLPRGFGLGINAGVLRLKDDDASGYHTDYVATAALVLRVDRRARHLLRGRNRNSARPTSSCSAPASPTRSAPTCSSMPASTSASPAPPTASTRSSGYRRASDRRPICHPFSPRSQAKAARRPAGSRRRRGLPCRASGRRHRAEEEAVPRGDDLHGHPGHRPERRRHGGDRGIDHQARRRDPRLPADAARHRQGAVGRPRAVERHEPGALVREVLRERQGRAERRRHRGHRADGHHARGPTPASPIRMPGCRPRNALHLRREHPQGASSSTTRPMPRPTTRTPPPTPRRSRRSTSRCASGSPRSRRASAGSSRAKAPSATSPATTA